MDGTHDGYRGGIMIDSIQHLRKGDGLIIVDVQWDFCPGGHLPVPDGHQVVLMINEWIEAALNHNMPVYMSRDWHPKGHISFKERGGPWPPHCIQDKSGAQFHPELLWDERILLRTLKTNCAPHHHFVHLCLIGLRSLPAHFQYRDR